MVGADKKTVQELWTERYRSSPKAVLPDNVVLRSQLSHHSTRSYRPDPLPDGALEVAIGAASSAATSCNLQTWSVVAIRDEATKRHLAQLSGGQDYVAQAPVFLVWVVDLSRLERIAEHEGSHSEGLEYEESFLMATLDTGIAAQNAVTAFESMGLGTVYIGGLRNNPEKVAELLNLPKRSVGVVGLCVGYPDENAVGSIKPRLSQEVILHHERYETEREKEYLEHYNKRADDYQKEQGLPSRRWTQVILKRFSQTSCLGGRHVMKDVLIRLGFPLR